ncbi:MAG TPA: rhodanese-like domain-containing protein [Abditibacteriaceae bacterium]|jgi:rhodanese-related sulfurtransferase
MSKATQEIRREELAELLTLSEKPILLDVLPHSYFRHSHLPGALHLPIDDIALRADQLLRDKDVLIVVYCQNPSCPAARKAVHVLTNLGYSNVREYRGGKDEWRSAGLPLEGESKALKTKI